MKSFASAYVNLLKTSIGAGVLSFPYLFNTYGVLLAFFLTLFIGFLATTGLVLLTISSQGIGRSADLSKLADHCIPFARIFVDLSVFLKCFGVSLSYMIITKDLIPNNLSNPTLSFITQPPIFLLIFLGFVAPFTYFSKIDRLKYTSFIGIFSIILVILAAIIRYVTLENRKNHLVWISPVTINWLTGLGKFIFSFTCHQNIFAVNAEITDNSLSKMKKLICTVSLSSFSMYVSFGLINFLIYGPDVSENILKNYPTDILGNIVRILYIIVMAVSYPLQLAPARTYLLNMMNVSSKTKRYKLIYFLVTTTLILLTYFIAISGVRLGIVYSIVGATASCFMCLILPGLFYLYMDDVEKSKGMILTAYLSFIVGIFIFVTTICSMIIKESQTKAIF